MHRIISQNRDIDPEWVVVDHTVPECRTETRPRRGARCIMFFFEICLEELPAQLERNLEALDCGISHNRVFGQREGFVEAGHRLLEIRPQRLGFCHSAIRCSATRRNFSETRAKSTTSIV